MLKHRGLSVSMLLFGFRRTAVSALLIVLAARLGFSQTAGTLAGTIKDPSGLAIASAVVSLSNDQGSRKRKTAATDAGTYTFTDLGPGDYTIHIDAPGFKDPGKKIKMSAGQQMKIDFALEFAGSSETVSVAAAIDPFNVVPETPTNSLFGLDKSLKKSRARSPWPMQSCSRVTT